MSIELLDDVRLFPSLFHYGISECGRPRCFKINEIGGCFEDVEILNSYCTKSFPFLCGFPDFVYACRNYGFNGNENELSSEVKIVLSHYYLSKIIQSVFACRFCFSYFDSFMKFMVFVATHAPSSSIRNDCIESKIRKDLTNHNGYNPCPCSIRVKYLCTKDVILNPFVSILVDHNHIEVSNENADIYATIINFNYCVSWNVSMYN